MTEFELSFSLFGLILDLAIASVAARMIHLAAVGERDFANRSLIKLTNSLATT
ncbi:MAG: hypothetical protein NW206_09780 [Hyphomonadaceae bacterium]|nr:hypothetical protein [Hyphomonadaceae bacterium]